jgi:hypothetical protein
VGLEGIDTNWISDNSGSRFVIHGAFSVWRTFKVYLYLQTDELIKLIYIYIYIYILVAGQGTTEFSLNNKKSMYIVKRKIKS